jgi:cardiolipin synthase
MNSPDNQMPEVVQKLRDLEKEYPYIGIMGVTDTMMHAKVMVADRKTVLVGSANLSISGMTKNYEMGLLVRNDEVAQQVEAILMRIWGKEV